MTLLISSTSTLLFCLLSKLKRINDGETYVWIAKSFKIKCETKLRPYCLLYGLYQRTNGYYWYNTSYTRIFFLFLLKIYKIFLIWSRNELFCIAWHGICVVMKDFVTQTHSHDQLSIPNWIQNIYIYVWHWFLSGINRVSFISAKHFKNKIIQKRHYIKSLTSFLCANKHTILH